MTGPTLYRVVDEHPYLDREEEFPGLELEFASCLLEDLTGEHAEQIVSDVSEEDGLPWKWVDDETGREVTMRLEVE